jgi:hypothetical protein
MVEGSSGGGEVGRRGRPCQTPLATSSTTIMTPRFLIGMASYDAASQHMAGRTAPIMNPRFLIEMASYDADSQHLAGRTARAGDQGAAGGRGLHSYTFQLISSALCGIGGARRGCVARVRGVIGGV